MIKRKSKRRKLRKQEAVIAATFCKEQALMDAIAEGCDFHSTSASLMFADKWKSLGGDPKPKGKPDNPILKKLRDSSKTTSFGLFYGKSAIGLGNSLDIPATTKDLIKLYGEECEKYVNEHPEEYDLYCREYHKGNKSLTSKHGFIKHEHKARRLLGEVNTADDLIDTFYSTFPNIHSFLSNCADEGARQYFIRIPGPFGRIRFFRPPADETELGAIRRQSMNAPIQG